MATFTLSYHPHRWRDMVHNDDPTPYEFISEILERDTETKRITCWNLLQPFIGEGAPSIDNFKIVEVDFAPSNLSGTVNVQFVVSVYFGCADQNNQHAHKDAISFIIDPATRTVSFTVTEQEPRDTVDEF